MFSCFVVERKCVMVVVPAFTECARSYEAILRWYYISVKKKITTLMNINNPTSLKDIGSF